MAEQDAVSSLREIYDQAALVVNPVRVAGLALFLLLVLTLSLFSYVLLGEGTLNSCQMVRDKLTAAFAEPYSGTERAPNLLEPIAMALVRKRVTQYMDEKSPFECAVFLYRLWSSPEEIKMRMRGVGQ